jgi:GNAT superfamily N-acetyltransferase
MASDADYKAFESPLPFRPDPELDAWRRLLQELPAAEVSIREAIPAPQDGRRMWDLQLHCPPTTVKPIRYNVSTIAKQLVLLAEIDGVHVGCCVAFVSPTSFHPLFVQLVAVAPEARRRGVGLALLSAATARKPGGDVAIATKDDNVATRALNERFAGLIGASIRRVPRGTYRDGALGIRKGDGYRVWVIRRPTTSAD